MSKKNSLPDKAQRRIDRDLKGSCRTVPVSDLPLDASTSLLLDGKSSRGHRKALLETRAAFVALPQTSPGDPAVKNLRRLADLSLVRLLRERARACRRAATFMYLAQASTLGTNRREAFEAAQHSQLSYLKQVTAEILHRTNTIE